MKMNIGTPWRRATQTVGSPGEPLYTQAELAAKLGKTKTELHGLMVRHSGLNHWPRSSSYADRTPYLYRLSDARRWLANLKENHG